jgi:hypothetical protein
LGAAKPAGGNYEQRATKKLDKRQNAICHNYQVCPINQLTNHQLTILCKTNPIFRKSQMHLTSFNTTRYAKLDTWSDAQKQTQTNPIQTQNKANSQNAKNECKLFFKRQLRRKLARMASPKQTQSNPISIQVLGKIFLAIW